MTTRLNQNGLGIIGNVGEGLTHSRSNGTNIINLKQEITISQL